MPPRPQRFSGGPVSKSGFSSVAPMDTGMWGREVSVDEEEGIWMRHKGRGQEGEGSPFSDGAHGQPEGELAVGTAEDFIPENGRWGWEEQCMCWRGKPLTDQKCEQMFP